MSTHTPGEFQATDEKHLCEVGYQYHDWELIPGFTEPGPGPGADVLIMAFYCRKCRKLIREARAYEDV